nr:neutral zinc metallopeptidase [uncultured Flavobacterium sp.]
MKWEGRRKSDNVEDRRGKGGAGKIAAGGGIIGIIAFLLVTFGGETGQAVGTVLNQVNQQQTTTTESVETRQLSNHEIEIGEFTKVVFADTEDIFARLFQENGLEYRKPKMVLFDDQVETACGTGTAAAGPFYCPGDEKVYMDLRFFEELRTKFGAKGGDFAIAYVIAHEVGHHIQHLVGTNSKVRQLQQRSSKTEGNKLSVAQELQADFYAGVWAHHNQKYLDADDIEEAISAAQAVGDDAIQSKMQGYVQPETFTHGTSKQRVEWFMRGFKTGDLKQGDTFSEMN